MSGSQYFQILRNVTHKLPLCPAWPALKQTPSHAAASPHVTVSFLHSPSPAFQLCQDKVTPNCTLNSPPCALATCTSCWTEPKNRDSCCIFFFFLWLLQISDVSIHHSVLGKIPGSNKTNYGLFDSILNPKCSTGTQLPHQHSLMEMERRYRQILLSFSIGCEKVVLSHLYHKSSCCCTLQKKRKQEQLEMLFRSRVKEIFRDFNGVVTWKADGKVRTSYPVGESRTSQSTDFLNPPNIMHYTSKCQLNHREPREHKALGVYSTTKCLYTQVIFKTR